MASLEKDWKHLIDIAKDGRQSVSALAVTTSQLLCAGMADLAQRELRVSDMITSMPKGFYVFLIKVDEHVVTILANQVEETLT